jgi:MFS family permease
MAAAEELPAEDRTTRRASVAATAASEPPVSVTTREERRRAFLVLFISLTCMGAGQSVMYSILPSLARELGITEFQAQLPFAVSGAIWLFTSTYWGKRSDHWGRRPVILMGLTAFGISFAIFAIFAQLGVSHVMAVAYAYPAMIAARAIYGIFGSGASPASQAYVADRTTRAERTQGVATINAAFGLGTTFGPLFGSVLVTFGAFVPYYFTAAVAFASAASIWFLLPERTRPKLKLEETPRAKLSWLDPRILPFVIFGTGISTAGAIPIPLAGYVFIDVLHLSTAEAPQYTSVGLLASALAAFFAQMVIVQRFNLSARALVRWGTGVGVVSFAMLAASRQFGPLVAAFVVSGLGFGLVRPGYAAAASLAVDPEEQGAVAGIMSATSAAGFIFGPLIATKLYKISPAVPFWFGAVLMTALYAYAFFSPHLKAAGALAPDGDVVDETAETQIPKA